MMKRPFFLLMTSIFCLSHWACTDNSSPNKGGETAQVYQQSVRLYTHRYLTTDQSLYQEFTQNTGINVEVFLLNSQDIASGLADNSLPKADLLFLPSVSHIPPLLAKGRLQPFLSTQIDENVPNRFLDLQGYWVGLTRWTMGAAFRKESTVPDGLRQYDYLTDPSLGDKLVMGHPDSSGFTFLVAGMIAGTGESNTRNWLEGIQANLAQPPSGNDYDQIALLKEGKADAAILSSSSFLRYKHSGDPSNFETASQLEISIPNDGANNNFYDLSVACMLLNAPNREAAMKLVGFLTEQNRQPVMAEAVVEYPVNGYALISDHLMSIEGLPQGNTAPEDAENQIETAKRLIRETLKY